VAHAAQPVTDAAGPAPGTPCWLELASPDPERSLAFYAGLFGWDHREVTDSAGRPYLVAALRGEPVAGVRRHTARVRDWTLYLAAPDLNRATAGVRRLGGAVLEARPHRVPGVGEKVLVDDPAGATVGLCRPAEDWAFTAGVAGALVWVELVTRRPVLADRFFTHLFGYQHRQYGDGRDVDYVVWSLDGDSVAGRVRMPEGVDPDTPSRWISHFAVDPDLGFDETLRRARTSGARLRFKPYHSTLGKVGVLSDPVGCRFAIIDPELAADWDLGSGADDPYDD
jgi:predicted enzyme related to lactoylglutathione lyase